MATRYSGKGIVVVTWNDQREHYVCRVSAGGKTARFEIKNPSEILPAGICINAVSDSAPGYDDAAAAAIIFATRTDGAEILPVPLPRDAFAWTESAPYVARTVRDRHPCHHRRNPENCDECANSRAATVTRTRVNAARYIQAMEREIQAHGVERKGRQVSLSLPEEIKFKVWRADSIAWAFEELISGTNVTAFRGYAQAMEYHGRCGGWGSSMVTDALTELKSALEDILGGSTRSLKQGAA
jgi:hypothetical protein